jgi:DNA-binding MarR family transcriptional regulator
VLERLFELASLLGDLMDGELTADGLSKARAEVLWVLHHHGPMTQRALSQALRCTPRNVTGLLDALQTAGLVARTPHPTDRRATLATLTDTGAATTTGWHHGYQTAADNLFDGIPPSDLTRFVRTLDHILDRIRATTGTAPTRHQPDPPTPDDRQQAHRDR